MIIPVGHEMGSVKRIPYVSIAIALLCLGVQILHQSSRQDKVFEQKLGALRHYWAAHPYLNLPQSEIPYLHKVLGDGSPQYLEPDSDGILTVSGPDGDYFLSVSELAEEQAQLVDLMTDTETAFANIFTQRWGLSVQHPKPLNFLTSLFLHADWFHLFGNLLFF